MSSTQNQIGQINPNGNIWMNTGDWPGVSFSITTSYKEMTSLGTNFTLMSPANYFDMAVDGRLRYIGSRTKTFNVTGYVATNNSGNLAIAIYKNGSLVTGAENYSGSTPIIMAAAPVEMATNDYVSLFIKRSANTSITISQVRLYV